MTKHRFHVVKDDEAFWKALYAWWASLEHDRGQRAALRRAKTPDEVFIDAAFWRGPVAALRRADIDLADQDLERLALPLGVLVHARELTGKGHFATQLGRMDKGGQQVRDVRFRKLLAVDDQDREGLYRMLIRLTRILGGGVHPPSLITGGFAWNDNTRRQWARRYYATSGGK